MATDYTGQKYPLAVQRLRASIYAIGPRKNIVNCIKCTKGQPKIMALYSYI